MNTRGSLYRTWLLIGIIVVTLLGLAIAALVPWRLQQQKIDTLNKQITTLQNQPKETIRPNPSTQASGQTFTSKKGVKVLVYAPSQDAKVSSPLAIIGEIPGNWSNEASFPLSVKTSDGTVIASGTATVLGDWMTDALVPFSAKVTYTGAPKGSGVLVLQKDNPSGLSANDDTIEIPISFQ